MEGAARLLSEHRFQELSQIGGADGGARAPARAARRAARSRSPSRACTCASASENAAPELQLAQHRGRQLRAGAAQPRRGVGDRAGAHGLPGRDHRRAPGRHASCRASSPRCTTNEARPVRGARRRPRRRRAATIKKAFRRARARAAPGREPPRPGGRGEVQGGRRGLRDPLRRRAPRDLRPLRLRGARLARVRLAGARLRLVRRHLRRVLRRRPVRRRSARGGAGRVQGGDVARGGGDHARARRRAATTVEVAYELVDACERCHGNGAEPGTPIETCPTLRRRRPGARGHAHGVRPARARAGLRRLRRRGPDPRRALHGVRGARAASAVRKTLEVDIPAGHRRRAAHPARPGAATPASAAGRRATSTCSCGWPRTSASCATAATW